MTTRFAEPDGTLIVALLDESGSMAPKRADTIGGFNTFLAEQAKGLDPTRLMLIKFNTAAVLAREATRIEDVPPLTPATYAPSGGTALYDAVLMAIESAKAARRSTDRLLVMIMTDGQENSSVAATLPVIQKAITECQAAGDWTFIYVGPDPEKWSAATGTAVLNTAMYDEKAPQAMYQGLASTIKAYRTSKAWASDNTGTQSWINAAEKTVGPSTSSGSSA